MAAERRLTFFARKLCSLRENWVGYAEERITQEDGAVFTDLHQFDNDYTSRDAALAAAEEWAVQRAADGRSPSFIILSIADESE